MAQNSLPKVVQDCHNLLIWLILMLDNFPRNRRFTLGERLKPGLLEILELLVEAAYVKSRRDELNKMSVRVTEKGTRQTTATTTSVFVSPIPLPAIKVRLFALIIT